VATRSFAVNRLLAGYTVVMTVLGVAVFAVIPRSAAGPVLASGANAVVASAVWAVIGLISVAAIALGIRRHAPLRSAAWWLLAGALAVNAAGDSVFEIAPPAANLFYVCLFPLVAAGFIQMTRISVVLRGRARLLDLLAFTCAAILLAWVAVVSPLLRANGLDPTERSVLAAYTMGDVLVLVTAVRLVVAASRSWSVLLLAAGTVGMLVGDVSYALARIHGGWQPGGWGELGYLVLYLCWGAAALHPSMAELTVPAEDRYTRVRGRWLVLLGFSVAVPPAVLLVEAATGEARGQVPDAVMIGVALSLMTLIVVIRLGDAIAGHRRAVSREASMRKASGALVAAASLEDVTNAVWAAVDRLMPDSTGAYHVELVDADALVRSPAQPPGSIRGWLADVRTLRPDLRDMFDGFETVLACPLTPDSHVLLVAADERGLVLSRDMIEVLAAQAAMALERITLTAAVIRRDSDDYVHAILRNTTDVVLVVDDDERVRCASPSLTALLGAEPPPFARLGDLLDTDDFNQVAQTLTRVEESLDPDGVRDCWSLRRADGTRAIVEVSYRDMRHDRLVHGLVITLRDVTEQRRYEREEVHRLLRDSAADQNRQNSSRKFM
jgi:PAS domain S-box-containing protein